MTSGPGKGSQARLSDVAQREGHLAPRSATWLWPQLQGHGRLVKLAKTHPGTLPRYGKTPSRIGRTSQHGGPLAGRLPKWAKEAERAALREIHVQRDSDRKYSSQKAPLRGKWNELVLISIFFFFRHIVKERLRSDPSHLCMYLAFSKTLMHIRACGHRTFCVFCVCLSGEGKIVCQYCASLDWAAHRVSLTHFKKKNQFLRPGATNFFCQLFF